MSTTFSPKDPAETLYYGIDFSALLGTGETITSATAAIRVTTGTDASPSSLLSGAPAISAGVVSQKVTGGVAGCTYLLGISITTSAGQTFVEAAPINVLERD